MRNSSFSIVCLAATIIAAPTAAAQSSQSVTTSPSQQETTTQVEPDASSCTQIAESCVPVDAKAWLVYDIDTGEILGEANADSPLRADGLVDAVLVVTALEHLDPTDSLIAEAVTSSSRTAAPSSESAPSQATSASSSADATTTTPTSEAPAAATSTSTPSSEASPGSLTDELDASSLLQPGQRYGVMEVIQAYVLTHSPQAAATLISALGGDDAARELMEATLDKIGTEHTELPDFILTTAPTTSTARELAMIYRYAYRMPAFATLTATTSAQIGQQTVTSDNLFMERVAEPIGSIFVENEEGNYEVQAAARIEDVRYAAVLLDTKPTEVRPWAQTALLLSAGADVTAPLGELPEPAAPFIELDETTAPPAEFETPASPVPLLMYGVAAVFVLGAVLWWLQRRRLLTK